VRTVFPLALLIFAGGCDLFASTPEIPTAEDMRLSAAASDGAFAAADEVCVGDGDISDSLARATEAGWKQFEPPDGSMMSKLRAASLEGFEYPSPEIVLLRKNENRAEVVLFQLPTLRGSEYIHHCDVIERTATQLDEGALRAWAAVPIETRQVDDSPVYFDLKGGRFASNVGGKATASYVPRGSDPRWPAEGLMISFMRSNLRPKGEN
jgi:hypothetical protein